MFRDFVHYDASAVTTRSPEHQLAVTTSYLTVLMNVKLKQVPRTKRPRRPSLNAVLSKRHNALLELANENTRRLTGKDRL